MLYRGYYISAGDGKNYFQPLIIFYTLNMEDAKTKLKLISSKDEAGNVRTFLFETGGLSWIAGQSPAGGLAHAGDTPK